jgi:branched-chain amino acid transport system substrate-binding protein
MKKYGILIMVILFTLCITISAYAVGEKTKEEAVGVETDEPCVDEWVIPNLLFMTGGWGVYGEEMLWGMNVALEEINSSGGIRGLPVKVEMYDTGTHQPELALTQMAKVLDTNPLVIMGPHGSTDAEACSQLAVDEEVYMIQSTSSRPAYEKWRPWVYISVLDEKSWTRPSAQYWVNEEKDIKSVVIFVQPEASTWYDQALNQIEALEAVGVEVADEISVTEAVDFGPMAVRALRNDPDGFVMYCYPEAMVKIAFELHKRGVNENRRFLFFHGAGTPEFWKLADGKLDGSYHWTIFNMQAETPKWEKLLGLYREEKKRMPSWTVVSCYDELYIIKRCFEDLKITGCPDRLEEERLMIRDYINNIKNFEFATGTFDIINGEKQEGVYMYRIMNNEPVERSRKESTCIE